jgi:hypothetical protein
MHKTIECKHATFNNKTLSGGIKQEIIHGNKVKFLFLHLKLI